MNSSERELRQRLARVRLLALDVDGVLTDGGVYVLDNGREFRRFDIKDGLGLKRVREAGIDVVIISASNVKSVYYRAKRLGIHEVYLGVVDKIAMLRQVCDQKGIQLSEVAYVGDDLPDLPVLRSVGLPCAPRNAVVEVKQLALYVTDTAGGNGAVREVCDLIVSVTSSGEGTITKYASGLP